VSIGLGALWLILVPAGTVEDGAGGPAKPAIEPPVDWKRVIIIIACLTVLTGFAFNAAIVSVPKLLDERLGEFAGSATAVGFLAFGVYIVAGFAQLLVGGLIDRFPVKPIFLAIAAAEAVAMFLVINAEGMALMIASAGMMALVYAGLPIADTLIGRNAPAHLRSRIYAFTYLISFGASTAAIPSIAYLHGNGGFAMLFAILAWMGVIVFAGVCLLPGYRPATLSPGK
jgi:MFS family permease